LHFVAVLNRDGGTLRTTDLDALCREAKQIFESHDHTIDCRVVAGAQVEKTLAAANADSAVDVVIAGGGDGTISSAAAQAFEAGKPLAVLPAGTMNLFARALGSPLALNQALEAIAAGELGTVDIATANGRPFVHQFGVGIHARLVRIREQMSYGSRIGKMLASLRAIGAAAVNPPQFEAELQTAKGKERRRVSGIAVSNNPLGEGQIHAQALDAGVLGVYIASAVSTTELLKLATDVFLGTWRASPMVSEKEVADLTLHFPKRELVKLDKSVDLKIHPGKLKVVLPRKPA
jgi:diacylglycerol kinase family enzyme